MPIDPNEVQWDPAPQPVAGAKGRPGGVIITDPTVVSNEQRQQSEEGRAAEDQSIQKDQNRFNNVESLRKQFDAQPGVKSYRAAIPEYIRGLKSGDDPAGDLSLIYAFAKVMDPDSVVREGEQASVAGGDTLYGQTISRLKKELGEGGQFSPQYRAKLREEMHQKIVSLNKAYNSSRQRYKSDAEAFNLDPARVIGDHDGSAFLEDIVSYRKALRPDTGQVRLEQRARDPAAPEGFFWANYADDSTPENPKVLGGVNDENGRPLGPEGGMGYDEQGNEIGLFGSVSGESAPPEIDEGLFETVTGDARSTEEIESLPEWTTMPELNDIFSSASWKTGVGTMMTDPEETARIIQQNYPGVKVRQDAKGNYILRSLDGQEYAIKPGFRVSDIPRATGAVLAFTPAGRATTFTGGATGAALTQAGIEGTQQATGGTFDTEEIVAAGAGGAGGVALQKAASPFGKLLKSALPTRAGAEVVEEVATSPAGTEVVEGAVAPLSETAQTEIGSLARKAVSKGPGSQKARDQLAVMAQINPEAKAAAERLGMDLPLDILSDDAQLKTLSGLTRSQIGGDADTAWRRTVGDTIRQADEIMTSIGASPDIAQVGADVMERMTQNADALERSAVKLRQEVDAAIDVRDRVDAGSLQQKLAEVINDMGGAAEFKQAASAEERKLFAMLGEGDVANKPTYARLNTMRDQIGKALFKGQGPWADTPHANLAKYYGALADDQLAYVEAKGGTELADKMRGSNSLFSKMYGERRTMQGVFGAQLEKDLAPLISRSVTGAQKGDAQALKKLLGAVPEDMRGSVLLTGIMKNATRNSPGGGFSFGNFAKTYRGLRENAPIFKQVADAVGPDGTRVLNDLYAISRRMAEGESRIVRTGASNQPLLSALNAEGLLTSLLKGTARRTAVTGTAAGVGGILGGPVGSAAGASVSEALQEALERGGKSQLDKLHTLLSSAPFRELAEQASTPEGAEKALRKLGGSKEWNNFAAKVLHLKTPEDRKAWLQGAFASGATTEAE